MLEERQAEKVQEQADDHENLSVLEPVKLIGSSLTFNQQRNQPPCVVTRKFKSNAREKPGHPASHTTEKNT